MATQQKCAHAACNCNVQAGQQYCSPQCQQQAQQSQQGQYGSSGQQQSQGSQGRQQQAGSGCGCGHAACQHG